MPESITGQYLSGRKKIAVPKKRRKAKPVSIQIKGASENNLKNLDIKIPLGVFTCVTGVSGSRKKYTCKRSIIQKLSKRVI